MLQCSVEWTVSECLVLCSSFVSAAGTSCSGSSGFLHKKRKALTVGTRDSIMLMCRFGCNRQYATLAAMDDHRKISHPDAPARPSTVKRRPVTACNDCGQTFPSVEALRQHQLSKPNHTRPAKQVGSHDCKQCNRSLRSQDSLEQHFVADHSLIQLARDDGLRVRLVKNFTANWRKPSRPGQVLSVFKVYNPGWRMVEFELYKKELRNGSNEVPRYHGTRIVCELGSGEKGSKLCQNEGCSLCCILRTGFKTAKARDTWQRFGKGIYTTNTSGKSNDYIRSSSNRRAVLLCRVLAGTVYRTQTDIPSLKGPPDGYHSVSGEVGRHLNYDETVVYSSKAILPCHMIVYTVS